MTRTPSRRDVVRAVAGLGAASLAGCMAGGDDPSDLGENEVAAGPNNANIFQPRDITVSVGDTVTWVFQSPGHNVSAYPDHHPKVELPDGAEPFGSMAADDNGYRVVEEGETYEYTFETPGTYQYVCVPHAELGMIGTVTVEE